MYITMEEYLAKPREDRRAHLKLENSCIEIGHRYNTELRVLLAHTFKVLFPVNKHTAAVCHACNNTKCSNVEHLYWGSPLDNIQDQKEAGTLTSINERTQKKYGPSVYKEIHKNTSSKGGKSNKGKPKSEEHKRKIKESLLRRAAPAVREGLISP